MGIIANGKLISHGSHAPFEKVADPSGVSEYRLRFTQNVTDGSVVELTLDESLIYATQAWIDENYIKRSEIVDNLTTNDATKPLSAKQGKDLQDNKLGKTENASSASKLQTARTVSFSGAATGSFNFDGSGNSSAVLTLANSGVAASTYGSNLKIPVVTVNAKGLITSVSEQAIPEVVDATESTKGKAQLATLAETLAGTNTTKIVTPYNLAQTVFGMNQTNKLKTVVPGTTYTHSNDKPSFLSISLNGSSGAPAIVRHNGNTLLDTNSSSKYQVSIMVSKGDTYYISGTSIVCVEFS
jgi:phage-related tail fiber protein